MKVDVSLKNVDLSKEFKTDYQKLLAKTKRQEATIKTLKEKIKRLERINEDNEQQCDSCRYREIVDSLADNIKEIYGLYGDSDD